MECVYAADGCDGAVAPCPRCQRAVCGRCRGPGGDMLCRDCKTSRKKPVRPKVRPVAFGYDESKTTFQREKT